MTSPSLARRLPDGVSPPAGEETHHGVIPYQEGGKKSAQRRGHERDHHGPNSSITILLPRQPIMDEETGSQGHTYRNKEREDGPIQDDPPEPPEEVDDGRPGEDGCVDDLPGCTGHDRGAFTDREGCSPG